MILYITCKPAFYKVLLFNEINKREPITVIYTSRDPNADGRNNDFNITSTGQGYEINYTPIYLDNVSTKKRLKQIRKIYRSQKWREVIIGGWDVIENLFLAMISSKKHNAIVCESSIYESIVTGKKGLVKRLILSRFSKVYPTGYMASEIFHALNFKGRMVTTGGCGILNYTEQPKYEPRQEVRKFLYVGRLIKVKNLEFLIKVFNELPNLELTIIGEGLLEKELKAMAKDNIKFLGYINNKDLPTYYRSNDVFVLASLSETWGLVVEEALNNGTPCLVSDRVGCNRDMVTEKTGLIFGYNDEQSLKDAIKKITDIDFYNSLREGVSEMDFKERVRNQVEAYFQ